ncbi:hypothetical protein JX265_011352 [Neoarthrinium moseri]|uniref:Uncharacterized protein n=1 Tax=Neoarthrinium moseri TaxID=1658444 RepID=A0A9P9WCT8_9PEZI|nr:hypothetical protein JX265_011352 [Neoarthrinium moseri]
MSSTPQRSPTRESASQSQEDIKGYEFVNEVPTHEDADIDDHSMSDSMPPAATQIKQSQSQTRTHVPDMEVDEGTAAAIDQRRHQTHTPEPQQRRSQGVSAQQTPSTPGRLAPFDWEDFESRYQKALADADQQESELLDEFEQLVKYFNVWASAASSHDNERAVKRLQTRTRYVHLSEEKLKQKKEHLSEVVKAFQSALALLSTA